MAADGSSCKVRVQIAAHLRWITAMDMHPSHDMVATVAEDATLAVWQLPSASSPKVQCLLSTCWMHASLTGVSFCGTGSNDVAVVAMDLEELRVFKGK